MVLAAALISIAALAPQAPAQAAPQAASQAKVQAETQPASPDGSKPYTVDGVRRAMTTAEQPSTDAAPVVPDRRGYRMSVEFRAAPWDPCSAWITGCHLGWTHGADPTWHAQFLAMTGPEAYMVPYSAMSNGQTLQAVASNFAINLALRAVVSLIHDEVVKIRSDRKQRRIENARAEIRGELAELERLNAAARASGQTAVR
jgi:hypothetical protein